ncbi:MAG: hypothetical protein JRI68_32000, partial [Deltaproteobacteria bacterium]|nr:hypothetical protein [Deltaproteobacteria bacterium]
MPEYCFDGVDNDCNGFLDGGEPDKDNDGFGPCAGDCDDNDPNVGPNQPEIDGDGIDNDCDNLVDLDVDGDGWTTTNGDCNDTDPLINPAAIEVCDDNIDNNCDGNTDTDCLSACDLAELFRSSVGCVYYAIDANNDPIENYDTLPYAVVVSNTDANTAANVEVQVRVSGVWTTQWTAAVAPISLHQFDLPDRHINYTGVNLAGAYRVVSDLPVVAYQFQPVNGATSFTSDASLLLPTSALDRYYYVVGWGEPSYGNAQFNVVATEDGTTVHITPAVNTVAGGGIPALTANVQWTYPTPLDAGDFIQIEANAAFTGTYITADKPVSVFSTHWCANIPSLGCCCDHLEEQVFGLQTWGQTYVASRLPVRNSGTPEPTLWHIFASENNTTVTYTAHPTVTGLPQSPQTMNQGDAATLSVSGTVANPGDFLVSADKPIYLMEYLSSSFSTNAPTSQAGDPAMNQAVPVEQFLASYVVLVPANWIYDYMVLTKPVGATVNVDGNPVPQSQFTAIDDTVNPPQWEVARITSTDGVHTLDGTAPFGVIVLGYDSYDSYAYPGGLDQKLINPIN